MISGNIMEESFASGSTETSDLLSRLDADSRAFNGRDFPQIASSSSSGRLHIQFVPRALEPFDDNNAFVQLFHQGGISSTVVASRSMSTRPEPVPARRSIFLDRVPMTKATWRQRTKYLAAHEFNEAEKTKTVMQMMSLLVKCLIQTGGVGGSAVLAVIADESTLRSQFSGCIQYADDGYALNNIENTCVNMTIFDDGFWTFLREFARHETGDRDVRGNVKDGAFLISSRSGRILGAAAKLPVWVTQFSVRNSGMRHETAVGIVTNMNHPCVELLLSEGGTLKVFTTYTLKETHPVYYEYAPFENLAGSSQYRDLTEHLGACRARRQRVREGSVMVSSVSTKRGEHIAWTSQSIKNWFLSEKSNGLKTLISNVSPVPRAVRRISSLGIIECEKSRSAYIRVRESLAQLRFKEAERLIVEHTSNHSSPRNCRDDVCMTFYLLWQFRFFYKGEHDRALRFLQLCEQHIETRPFARQQVLLLQISCWKAKNLRNLAVRHKNNHEVQVDYFSQSFQCLQRALLIYQSHEVDDVWAAEVHELKGRWVIDVLRTCKNGARVVLSHIAVPHGTQIVQDAEDQVQQCATFLWHAEWIDGVLQSLFATLLAQELRSHTVKELHACVRRHDELLQLWGDLPITARTKMRFAMFSIRVRVRQLAAATRATRGCPGWYATIDKDIAAAFTSIAHLKLAKGHKEWHELRQLKARHKDHKRARPAHEGPLLYFSMLSCWFPCARGCTRFC
eukprot:GEMP01024543.1.p1 GENE.GEMP01024543.1~~GEMP01024543.1.p1  ORF type:complete len:736 (+),score=111.46 GEMP01024543.1:55-2262(+)